MECARAREGLWPAERPKLVGAEVGRAREHVDACPECRDYFAQDRALLEAYERIRAERAPREVRERVFDALARARAGTASARVAHRGSSRRQAAAGGLVAAALVGGLWLGVLPGEQAQADPADEATMFVEDYLRRAVGQDHIVTSDPDEVARFLMRELGIGLRPLELEGLLLERAEVCLLEGQRGAMVVYKLDGRAVSHYLIPRQGTPERSPELSSRGSAADADLPVVTWSSPLLEQALVGDVPPERLLKLAEGAASES